MEKNFGKKFLSFFGKKFSEKKFEKKIRKKIGKKNSQGQGQGQNVKVKGQRSKVKGQGQRSKVKRLKFKGQTLCFFYYDVIYRTKLLPHTTVEFIDALGNHAYVPYIYHILYPVNFSQDITFQPNPW